MLIAITGKLLKKTCGSANLRESNVNCKGNVTTLVSSTKLHVNPALFLKELVTVIDRYMLMFQIVFTNRASHTLTYMVYYEQLQNNSVETIQQTSLFLRPTTPITNLRMHLRASSSFNYWLGWKDWQKRSSDDLRSVIENYKELLGLFQLKNNSLASTETCLPLLHMLQETGFTVFDMSLTRLNQYKRCIQSITQVINFNERHFRRTES